MTPNHKHGWPTCSLASQICRRAGLLNCCHGIGTIRTCRWSLDLAVMLYAIRGPRRMLSLIRGAVVKARYLFAGSDGGGEHWAVIASLIETCKMNGVDPQAYRKRCSARTL